MEFEFSEIESTFLLFFFNPQWTGGGAKLVPSLGIDNLLCSESYTYEL